MISETTLRTCQACGKTIRGRSDKKFCDDSCRNNFNNQLKAPENNFIRNINNRLRKNRRIMQQLLPAHEKLGRVNKDRLVQMGYQLSYFTHTFSNQKGDVYYFCYDYGLMPLENNWFLLVRQHDKY